MKYGATGVDAGVKEILILAVAAIAIILLLPKLLSILIRSTADEAGKLVTDAVGSTAAGVKDSVDNAVNAVFNTNKTDLQTISEITQRDYGIQYADMTPAQKQEIQVNLGITKGYYEAYGTQLPWDAFQTEVIKQTQTDGVDNGGCPPGYHLSDNGYGCVLDGTATTISRSEVPAGYQGTYWAGKRIV